MGTRKRDGSYTFLAADSAASGHVFDWGWFGLNAVDLQRVQT